MTSSRGSTVSGRRGTCMPTTHRRSLSRPVPARRRNSSPPRSSEVGRCGAVRATLHGWMTCRSVATRACSSRSAAPSSSATTSSPHTQRPSVPSCPGTATAPRDSTGRRRPLCGTARRTVTGAGVRWRSTPTPRRSGRSSASTAPSSSPSSGSPPTPATTAQATTPHPIGCPGPTVPRWWCRASAACLQRSAAPSTATTASPSHPSPSYPATQSCATTTAHRQTTSISTRCLASRGQMWRHGRACKTRPACTTTQRRRCRAW
mmetsp:Transcript_10481/g.25373  ORF Transcript_10481/g.25373 Transcript_10481/m.25373 type:complete len:262 (+) Transcript_10481:505-1290(+)